MQEIFNFLREYWKPIVGLILVLVSLLLALVRKKPVSDIVSYIYKFAIMAICDSECQPTYASDKTERSKEKKQYAITFVSEELKAMFPNLHVEFYEKLIAEVIEAILSTPQKKK